MGSVPCCALAPLHLHKLPRLQTTPHCGDYHGQELKKKKKRKQNTRTPPPLHHLRRRRSLILPAQDLVSVIKFLCSFSVAQLTSPGLLASQALHLARCPLSSAPAAPCPGPPLPREHRDAELLEAPVLLEFSLVLNWNEIK